MENIVLEIDNIQKSFAINYAGKGNVIGTEYKNVINGLSFRLERGEVTALVGGNGAGKTTIFNLVSGLLRPDTGKIVYYGREKQIECTRATPWQISGAGIGRLFQGTRIFGELSVMDHLLLQSCPAAVESPFYNILKAGKSRRTISGMRDRIHEELEQYDEFREIIRFPDKVASSLSYAQQRMLSIAGLLIGDYELLLMDEPSSGLSPESNTVLYHLLDKVKEVGKSVFLIEHNMEFVRIVADHTHYMAEGKIKYSGTPEQVLETEEVRQSYLL